MRKVQYAPPTEIVPIFQQVPFAYDIASHEGIVITSLNRIRRFLSEVYGITDASKNIILAILADTSGRMIGEVVNTDGNISRIFLFHVCSFRRRVEIALKNGEIKTNIEP